MATQADIDQRNSFVCVNQMAKTGLGYNYIVHQLDKVDLENAQDVAHGGSDAESIVLAALKYAISDPATFSDWLADECQRQRRHKQDLLAKLAG